MTKLKEIQAGSIIIEFYQNAITYKLSDKE